MERTFVVSVCIREARIQIVAYRLATIPLILRDNFGPIWAKAVTLCSRPHKPKHVYHLTLQRTGKQPPGYAAKLESVYSVCRCHIVTKRMFYVGLLYHNHCL